MNKTSSDLLERSFSALCVLLPQGLIVDEWPPTSRRVTKVEGKALTYARSEVLFWRGGCEYADWDRCGAARPMGRTECRSGAATRLVVTWQISPAVLRRHVANQTWSSIKLIYVKAYSASRSSCYGICRRVCFICVCQFKWLHVHACAKRHIEFQRHSCQMKTDRCARWYRMRALKAAPFFIHTPRYLHTHNYFSRLKVEGKMFHWSAPAKYLSRCYLTIRFKITFLKG